MKILLDIIDFIFDRMEYKRRNAIVKAKELAKSEHRKYYVIRGNATYHVLNTSQIKSFMNRGLFKRLNALELEQYATYIVYP